MNILVTGAKGMVGTALVNNLKNIRDGKNRTRIIEINEIYEYDLDNTEAELDEYCAKADFVFNLAGVNRPENPEDFMKGNFGFASQLLDTLKKHNNKAGITTKELLNATDMAIEMKQKGVLGKPCPDYVDETVSMKVVRIIQGYVNVVNKMVWRKEQ